MKIRNYLLIFFLIILLLDNTFGQEKDKGIQDSTIKIFPFILKLNPEAKCISNLNYAFNKPYYNTMDSDIPYLSVREQNKLISENINWGLKGIKVQNESELLIAIRKYLGISKNMFALILAILHILKYH